MAEPFNVEAALNDGVHAFAVAGELDQATADELRRPLLEAVDGGARAILLDLTDCGFIDSTGLSVLVEARRALLEDDPPGSFSVCCPDPQVRRLLEITGLDRAIEVYDGRAEALAAMAVKR